MENKYTNVSGLGEKEIKALTKETLLQPILFGCLYVPLLMFALGGCCFTFDWEFAIIFFVFGGLMAIVYPIILMANLKKSHKKMLEAGKILNRFSFTEESLQVESQRKTPGSEEYLTIGTSTHFYSELYRVLVTQDYIYLFINKQQSYVLDRVGMIDGTSAELIEFLQAKVKRFKVKNKTPKQENKTESQ